MGDSKEVEYVGFTVTSPSTLQRAVGFLESDKTFEFANKPRCVRSTGTKALAEYAFYTEESPSGNQDEVIAAGAIPKLVELLGSDDEEAKKHARVALGAVVALHPEGQRQSVDAIAPLVREMHCLWDPMAWEYNNKQIDYHWGHLCSTLTTLCIILDGNIVNQRHARSIVLEEDAENQRGVEPLAVLTEIRDEMKPKIQKYWKSQYNRSLASDNCETHEKQADLRTFRQIQCTACMLISILETEDSLVAMLRLTQSGDNEAVECVRFSPDLLDEQAGVGTVQWLNEKAYRVHSTAKQLLQYPLHESQLLWAVVSTNLGMVSFLVGKGASIQAIDKSECPVLRVSSLKRVTAKFLLHHGAHVNATNSSGETPLHVAVRNKGNFKLVRALIRANAELNVKDKNGVTTLQYLLTRRHTGLKAANTFTKRERYKSARFLCGNGALFNEAAYASSRHKYEFSRQSDKESKAMQRLIAWRDGLVQCVRHWIIEHRAGFPLSEVPEHILLRGARRVDTFLRAIDHPRDVEVRRHKVCVIGSSDSGKTSFITSLYWEEEARAKFENRTIGIDLSDLTFTSEKQQNVRHEVKFWDFAGQDIYQGVHTPFFTPETFYVLCVDFSAFDKIAHDHRPKAASKQVIESRIGVWVRLVLHRQPQAEFLQVLTKADKLKNHEHIRKTKTAIKVKIQAWVDNWLNELEGAKVPYLDQLKSSLQLFKKTQPVVTSCASDFKVRLSLISSAIVPRKVARMLRSSPIEL